MPSLKTLLLIATLLPAIGYAEASQTFYFGEGQSRPQSHHASKHINKRSNHHHSSLNSQHQSSNSPS
jgi:hypothetical protein